jgi:hypothetical protein
MLPSFNRSMRLRRVVWKHIMNFPKTTHTNLDKDKNFQGKSLLRRSCIPGFRKGLQTPLCASTNQNTFLLPCSTQKQPQLLYVGWQMWIHQSLRYARQFYLSAVTETAACRVLAARWNTTSRELDCACIAGSTFPCVKVYQFAKVQSVRKSASLQH